MYKIYVRKYTLPLNNKLLGSWSIPPTYAYDIIREQYSDHSPWVLVPSVQYRGKVPSHRECSGNVLMLPGLKSLIETQTTAMYDINIEENMATQ